LTIIGNGNIAFALAQGLSKKYKLEILGRNIEKLREFQKKIDSQNLTINILGKTSLKDKIVILAVKPNNLKEIATKIKEETKIIYSVLAGVKIEDLRKSIKSQFYIRAMPNLSAIYQKSITSLTGDIEIKNSAIELFSNIGETIWLNSEDEVDIATAIAGSGPAFLSLIAEALTDGGVFAGLKRGDSEKIVQGLFNGFPYLLNNEKPSLIKDKVMSPKGTTAYGYKTLEEGKVRATLIKTIENSYKRALELGKN
jgi:pyrroline-5-carboxylate reductase